MKRYTVGLLCFSSVWIQQTNATPLRPADEALCSKSMYLILQGCDGFTNNTGEQFERALPFLKFSDPYAHPKIIKHSFNNAAIALNSTQLIRLAAVLLPFPFVLSSIQPFQTYLAFGN